MQKIKISPKLIKYVYTFLVAAIIDIVVHFFSERKFISLTKTNIPTYGFFPELNVYYKSLGKYGPFPYVKDGDGILNPLNSWILGFLITGTFCLLVVIIVDLIMYFNDDKTN